MVRKCQKASLFPFSAFLISLGSILTFLAISDILSIEFGAVLEWMGVFFLMSGLTYLYSPRHTAPLSILAFLFGSFLDPVVFSGFTFQIWLLANTLVSGFALAGTSLSAISLRFITIE
jgi:hypothetical protein